MVVGTGYATKTWHLPKDLLVNASTFFAAALDGQFTEAASKTVHLPEDTLDAFALFIQWLYVGEISCNNFCYGGETSGDQCLVNRGDLSNDGPNYATQVYLQACTLGDKLGCILFMDLATLELLKHHKYQHLRPETMLFIFEHFGAGSKLRRFAIDQLRWDLWGWHDKDAASFVHVSRSHEDIGPEFLDAMLETKGVAADEPQAHRGRYLQVLTGTELN